MVKRAGAGVNVLYRHEAGKLGQLTSLGPGSIRTEQNVGAERHLYAVAAGEFDSARSALGDLSLRGLSLGARLWVGIRVCEEGLQTPSSTRLGHGRGGACVGELAMLDAHHAALERAQNALGRVDAIF